MAVYTEVGFDEADQLVQALGLGALTDLRGIRSGIENTNYYASTARGQWVLTVFERLTREQLPYYLQLMQHLALQGIPVPAPQAAADGTLVHTLAGKPAAVVTRLPGSHRMAPDALHCAQVGAMLARMHRAGSTFAGQQPHLRGLAWWASGAHGAAAPARAAGRCATSWPFSSNGPVRQRAAHCHVGTSTPTCSATT
jgi:homoserine kinase type II